MALSDSLVPALAFRAAAGTAMAGMYMPGLRALTHGVNGTMRARIAAWYTSSLTIGALLSFLFGRVGTLLGSRGAFIIAGQLGAGGVLVAWAALRLPRKRAMLEPRTGHAGSGLCKFLPQARAAALSLLRTSRPRRRPKSGGDHAAPSFVMGSDRVWALFTVHEWSPGARRRSAIDELLRSSVGKDWVTNGGDLTNQRYSTLKGINPNNVKQLKGAWMTRLMGSGYGGKYSFEATPLVRDGIMYVVTGNDDVFALNAKTGAILWQRWSGIDQKINTVCCGGTPAGWRWVRGNCSWGSSTTGWSRSTSTPARKSGRRRSRSGSTAIASPARRCITTVSFTAGFPAANSACAAD